MPKRMRSMCLLCNRHTTTELHAGFAQQRVGATNKVPLLLLQNHCNRIDVEGEYTGDVALPVTSEGCLFTGIVRPFVRYNKNHYVPAKTIVNGRALRCVIETDALDFRLAPVRETVT